MVGYYTFIIIKLKVMDMSSNIDSFQEINPSDYKFSGMWARLCSEVIDGIICLLLSIFSSGIAIIIWSGLA